MKKFLLATAAVAVAMSVVLPVRAEGEAKAEKPKKREYTGEITKIEGTSVTVKKKDEEKTFTAGEKLKVVVAGKDAAEIGDLKVGDRVTVTYTSEGDKNVSSKIEHKPKKEKEAKAEEKAATK